MLGFHCDRHCTLAINQQTQKLKGQRAPNRTMHLTVKELNLLPRGCPAPAHLQLRQCFLHHNKELNFELNEFFLAVKVHKNVLIFFNRQDTAMGTHNHYTLLRYQPIQSERNNYWINGVENRWERQLSTRNGLAGSTHSPFIFPHPFCLIAVFSVYHRGSTRQHTQCKEVVPTTALRDDTCIHIITKRVPVQRRWAGLPGKAVGWGRRRGLISALGQCCSLEKSVSVD